MRRASLPSPRFGPVAAPVGSRQAPPVAPAHARFKPQHTSFSREDVASYQGPATPATPPYVHSAGRAEKDHESRVLNFSDVSISIGSPPASTPFLHPRTVGKRRRGETGGAAEQARGATPAAGAGSAVAKAEQPGPVAGPYGSPAGGLRDGDDAFHLSDDSLWHNSEGTPSVIRSPPRPTTTPYYKVRLRRAGSRPPSPPPPLCGGVLTPKARPSPLPRRGPAWVAQTRWGRRAWRRRGVAMSEKAERQGREQRMRRQGPTQPRGQRRVGTRTSPSLPPSLRAFVSGRRSAGRTRPAAVGAATLAPARPGAVPRRWTSPTCLRPRRGVSGCRRAPASGAARPSPARRSPAAAWRRRWLRRRTRRCPCTRRERRRQRWGSAPTQRTAASTSSCTSWTRPTAPACWRRKGSGGRGAPRSPAAEQRLTGAGRRRCPPAGPSWTRATAKTVPSPSSASARSRQRFALGRARGS